MNEKVCRVGKKGVKNSCQTKADFTAKSITPMDGFVCHGEVKEDWLMLKGCFVGVKKRPLILRKSMMKCTAKKQLETIDIEFIDTLSEQGHG